MSSGHCALWHDMTSHRFVWFVLLIRIVWFVLLIMCLSWPIVSTIVFIGYLYVYIFLFISIVHFLFNSLSCIHIYASSSISISLFVFDGESDISLSQHHHNCAVRLTLAQYIAMRPSRGIWCRATEARTRSSVTHNTWWSDNSLIQVGFELVPIVYTSVSWIAIVHRGIYSGKPLRCVIHIVLFMTNPTAK